MTATASPTTVTVARSEIARALRAASSVKSKTVRIALDGDQVVVTAYTADTAVRVTLDAPGQPAAGETYVQRTTLAALLPYCDAELHLAIGVGGNLEVLSGDTVCVIPVAHIDATATYDHAFDLSENDAVTLEAPVLVEALRRTLPFAGRDYTRPVLCVVALYPIGGVAVATDSYRLAVVKWGDDDPEELPILIHVEAAESLRRLLGKQLGTVTIDEGASFITARFEDTIWSVRAQMRSRDGERAKYPQWRALLPAGDAPTTVKLDREDLLAGARCAGALASKGEPLRVNVTGGCATVAVNGTSDRPTMQRRLASSDVTGEDVQMGVNPAFVADLCAAAPVERLVVKILGPLRPLLVEAARDMYLLMPIRLNV